LLLTWRLLRVLLLTWRRAVLLLWLLLLLVGLGVVLGWLWVG
jgi:hypothetical protein